jgi:transketolase
MTANNDFKELSKLVRHHILVSTSASGSGHPTSSLSAVELTVPLLFKYLKYDFKNPKNPNNDRLLFSKGHAAPLLYALYSAAGALTLDELKTLREIDSVLEGHPTPRYDQIEVSTGSLGQGLSVGMGMALNAKYLDELPYKTYVLLGDGEMAEGSVWEAANLSSHYKLDNLIAIVDVNRLGQSQETMFEHDLKSYGDKFRAFGWDVFEIDGHDLDTVDELYGKILADNNGKPKAIIAKTFKGAGISFLSDADNWHGKALPEDKLQEALKELGEIKLDLIGNVEKPEDLKPKTRTSSNKAPQKEFKIGDSAQTRKVYGETLAQLVNDNPNIIALDAETKNSTFAEIVKNHHPENYFEMFIAEQNMISVGLGLSKRNKSVFCSSFAAFLTRSYDQVRMAAVSKANLKVVGSHAGVSIGEDGPSQMGLEDLSMFRAICGSTVLCPGDAVATQKIIANIVDHPGITYVRTNRPATPVYYSNDEKFPIGGSKTLKSSDKDQVTLVAIGVTLEESVKAYDELSKEGISVRVIDAYSIKPIDKEALLKASNETKAIIIVEDHWVEGGLGDAVKSALADQNHVPIHHLAVSEMPRSGRKDELLDWAGISTASIIKKVKELI